MKVKFKKRYVLGEGYPSFCYMEQMVGLVESMDRAFFINYDISPELQEKDIPKYRLELVRVKI